MAEKIVSDIKELRGKSEKELVVSLAAYRDRLWNLKKELVAGKVKNVRELQEVKKAIARILTIMHPSHESTR